MLFKRKTSNYHIHVIIYSLPFSIGSHFQQIHISLLLNIVLSSLIRANSNFIHNKPSRGVLKKKLNCKQLFYDTKSSFFVITLPCWWNLSKSFKMMRSFQVKLLLRWLVGFRFGNKYFAKIVTSLVTVLLKMTLCICISSVFTKNPLF